jgi:hypothetical protein
MFRSDGSIRYCIVHSQRKYGAAYWSIQLYSYPTVYIIFIVRIRIFHILRSNAIGITGARNHWPPDADPAVTPPGRTRAPPNAHARRNPSVSARSPHAHPVCAVGPFIQVNSPNSTRDG